jgi:hypothetical protein
VTAAAWSAIAGWVSALVAFGSAIAAIVAAVRSKSAKKSAEQQAKDAVAAAEQGAANMGRIATVLEARYAPEVNKQSLLVYISTSPVTMGRQGWIIKNASDAPISKLDVSAVNQSQLVIYRGSGPEAQDTLAQPLLGPGESTKMFRPMNVDSPEIEQIQFTFFDNQGGHWKRVGTEPPVRLF